MDKYTPAKSKNPCASLPPHLGTEWYNTVEPEHVARRTPCLWRCGVCAHEWMATKERRMEGQGCPACNGKQPAPPTESKQETQEATPKAAPMPESPPAQKEPPKPPVGANHVALLIDASGSMGRGFTSVMRVDAQVAIEDMVRTLNEGAARVPTSLKTWYFGGFGVKPLDCGSHPFKVPPVSCSGGTPLRDAIGTAIDTLYDLPSRAPDGGPNTRLVLVVTDGQENDSTRYSADLVRGVIDSLQGSDLWTFALLVPKGDEEKTARLTGVPIGNIRGWDVNSTDGAKDAGQATAASIGNFYQGRTQGVTRTSRFFVDTSKLDEATVLKSTWSAKGRVLTVDREATIRDFVEGAGLAFTEGKGFYELTKGELLREGRTLIIAKRTDGDKPVPPSRLNLRTGTPAEMRALLGLPPTGQVPIGEGILGDWRVFVQSTSFNRKLVRGTLLVYLDGADTSMGPTWRPDPSKYEDLLPLTKTHDTALFTEEVGKGLKAGGFCKIAGTLREILDVASTKIGTLVRFRDLP